MALLELYLFLFSSAMTVAPRSVVCGQRRETEWRQSSCRVRSRGKAQ